MNLEDFNALGTAELLKYQDHIQSLILARQKEDYKVLSSANVKKITAHFNLDETHDLPEYVWKHFWENYNGHYFESQNFDFYLLISSLKQFDALENKPLDKSGFDDERWTLSEQMIIDALYEENTEFLQKILHDPKLCDKLAAMLDNNRAKFCRGDYFNQSALDLLIEKKLLKIDEIWIKQLQSFTTFTTDKNNLKEKRMSARGLFSILEAAIRHAQFPVSQKELKKLVIEGWQVMELETLKKLNHELLIQPVLYQEISELSYKKNIFPFKESEKNQLSKNYAALLNDEPEKVQWIMALPQQSNKSQDNNANENTNTNNHHDWHFLHAHTEGIAQGLIQAYDNISPERFLYQITQNLDCLLKTWKEEASTLYENIISQAIQCNKERITPNTLFDIEFNRVILQHKLHRDLIENNEQHHEDSQHSDINNGRKMKI